MRRTHTTALSRLFLLLLIGVFLFLPVLSDDGYEVADDISAPAERAYSARILFAGDIMLDRYVRRKAEERGEYESIIGKGLRSFIKEAHYTVANLEGPITDYSSKSADSFVGEPNNTTFTFSPETAGVLAEWGFDALSLANNHSYDFSSEGLQQTRRWLSEAGVSFFGDSEQPAQLSNITRIRGITAAFIGYSEFSPGPDIKAVLAEVRRVRPYTDFIAVIPHWGREYTSDPTEAQRKDARAFVDAGADAVIGSHAHVIGEQEVYKGAPIYYSLGNFIFDQYFSRDVRCGLALVLEIEKRGAVSAVLKTKPLFIEHVTDGRIRLGDCNDKISEIN